MLPVVAGRAATTQQILIYSVLLVPVSLLPWVLGFSGPIYGATSAICGAILVVLAYRLRRSRSSNRRAANRLFAFSIFYLFALFAALITGNNGNRSSPTLSPRAALTDTASVEAEFLPQAARTARSFDGISAEGA
jgi:protoheme IX farnesyltransferase